MYNPGISFLYLVFGKYQIDPPGEKYTFLLMKIKWCPVHTMFTKSYLSRFRL